MTLAELLNENSNIIIAGISTIIGLLIGSMLTSFREVKNYKRYGLEKSAFTLHEFYLVFSNFNENIRISMQSENARELSAKQIELFVNEAPKKVRDIDMVMTLHCNSLQQYIGDYVDTVNIYIDSVAKIYKNLTDDQSHNSAQIKQIEILYANTEKTREALIKAISSEIYTDSFLHRILKFFSGKHKWPSN